LSTRRDSWCQIQAIAVGGSLVVIFAWGVKRGQSAFFITALVAKPSVQTRFILEAMANHDRTSQDNWSRVMERLDDVCVRLKDVEKVQQQLVVRPDLAATVAEQAATDRVVLSQKLEETGRVVAQMRLEQMGKELGGSSDASQELGGQQQHIPQTFKANQEKGDPVHGGNGGMHGFQGEPRPHGDYHHQVLPKLPFPKFSEGDPLVWLDKCLESSLNLEQTAPQWWQFHKLRHGFGGWQEFSAAVILKFGVDAYPRALRRLMELRQTNSLDQYVKEFDQVRYGVAVHNSQYDDVMTGIPYTRRRDISG
jgi:hypothetical protein